MSAGRRKRAGRVLGIDTGGTFTDLVLGPAPGSPDPETGGASDTAPGDAGIRTLKLASTPDAPARALLDGVAELGGVRAGDHVVHGTTVALNALLTGRVAPAALVTGRGFRDLIEVARQDRPDIYALHPRKPEPLIPRSLRFEVDQRSWPDPESGAIVEARAPSAAELAALAKRIGRSRAESIAVCLLHSWATPEIEERIGAALAGLGLPVSLSGRLLGEHREYERFSTAAVNAVLAPLMRAYLGPLEERLGEARLSILQSNGGTLPAARAALEPVRVILSGPAGGVVGAARAAREAGLGAIVTLDMGGTSTDVAFHDAAAEADGLAWRGRRAGEPIAIAGHPVGVPTLDIHTIGCGGGSLVTVDAGGAMHVGPESAGAEPGPVCYGKSLRPTVTDAHVLLGHIARGSFLGGELELDVPAVERAFAELARELGADPVRAARGVLDVARAGMRRALGVMTMQRGQDPRRLPLVAFGGAGGLHAAALAESLGMPCALVPHRPGLLSAWGMTGADALRELARTVLAPLSEWRAAKRRTAFAELGRAARESLVRDGHAARAVELELALDLRYRGQSFELRVAEGRDAAEDFHRAHEAFFGYRLDDRPVELVCLRVRAAVRTRFAVPPAPRARALPQAALVGERRAVFDRPRRARVVARERLGPGHHFEGPALVEEYSGTTLVPPGWRARVTEGGHLLLERVDRAAGTRSA